MKVYPPGTHLGRFEVVSYPHFGDISINYTCLDREKSCPASLKALRPEWLASSTAQDCFAQGGLTWVDLGEHPHIVRCSEVLKLESTGQPFLVLQTVIPDKEHDTATLAAWLGPGQPLPVIQSLLFAVQITRGMRFVTDRMPGFVHGDLKPENVIVGGGRLSQADVNRLRITDLGLVSVLKVQDINPVNLPGIKETSIAQTQSIQGVVGTPLYMSPEQWQGEPTSVATDVYALGCLLYKMLVGRNPVAGETTTHLRNAHCAGSLRPLPFTLPLEVRDLTTRCLALKPDERYQTWEELENAIASAYKEMVHFPVPAPEAADTPTQSERKLEGWFLNAMGCASHEAGNISTSEACLELALKAGRDDDDRKLIGSATGNLGDVYRMRGDTQRALEHHEKALTIAGEIGDKTLEGSALNGMGMDNLQSGNPRQAIQYLEKSLALAREIHDRQGEMAALVNMGGVYQQLGDFHRSIQYFEQELGIARQVGNRRGESVALTNLGGIYSSLGDHRRAVQCQEQALKIKLEIGDLYSQIANLNNLANAYRDLGDARQAFDNYNKSLEIALELGDRRGEAFALNNMGATYSNLGNLDQALKYHQQALVIFNEIGDRRSQGDCLTNLGFIYMTRGDKKQAQEYCEQAIAIDREVGDMFGLALDSFNMANLYVGQNLFREALSYAEEAAQIMERVGHPEKAPQTRELVATIRARLGETPPTTIGNLAATDPGVNPQILQIRQDNPELTEKMSDEDILELLHQSDQAMANDRPTVFITPRSNNSEKKQALSGNHDFEKRSMDELIMLGQQLVYQGHWQEAEQAFDVLLKKAGQARHILYQSLTLLFQGRLYSDMGNQAHALGLFRQALDLAGRTDDLKLVCQIYSGMGTAFERQGNYKNAIEHHRYAIDICVRLGDEQGAVMSRGNLGNSYRQLGDFEQAARAYRDLLDYAIRIGAEQMAAQVYCNLGLVYQQQGLRDQAIEMELKSVEIASRHGDPLTAANAYTNLGILRKEQGDYPTAVQMLRKALEVNERLGRIPEVAKNYADLAGLYTKMDDPMLAFLSYDRALIFYDQIGELDNLAKIHFNMGNLYRQQGKTAQAREQFKEAQKIFESIGEFDKAKQAAQQFHP